MIIVLVEDNRRLMVMDQDDVITYIKREEGKIIGEGGVGGVSQIKFK